MTLWANDCRKFDKNNAIKAKGSENIPTLITYYCVCVLFCFVFYVRVMMENNKPHTCSIDLWMCAGMDLQYLKCISVNFISGRIKPPLLPTTANKQKRSHNSLKAQFKPLLHFEMVH